MHRQKTVGILGGMGPYATLSFYQMLLEFTPAAKDWDHLRVILDINPHVPSRSRHHLYGEPSPVPAMLASCRKLEAYPVDFIVIPCNSASHYLPELQAGLRVPLLNIMQVTAAALPAQLPRVRRVAVLGGVITHERRTYEPFLMAHGIAYVQHAAPVQRRVEALIERIKLNAPRDAVLEDFRRLVGAIRRDYDVDAVILGCTEFGCLGACSTEVPTIDSSRELARYTAQLALGRAAHPAPERGGPPGPARHRRGTDA